MLIVWYFESDPKRFRFSRLTCTSRTVLQGVVEGGLRAAERPVTAVFAGRAVPPDLDPSLSLSPAWLVPRLEQEGWAVRVRR